MISGVKIKPPVAHWIRRRTTMATMQDLRPAMLKASRGFGYQLAKLTLAKRNDLLAHLHNKLAEMRPARERQHTTIGRLINTVKMARTEFIELDGIIFCGLLELLDESAEVTLNRRCTYLVPFAEVERMVGVLEESDPANM
ncbi:MAG: hypothetical protein ACPGSM_08375 [Thiolinea sp.]